MEAKFSDPVKNLERFGLSEGMRVADFGSGSGHYTRAASAMVGSSGVVYAIDIQQPLLKKVKNLSSCEHCENIEVIRGDIERPGGSQIADASVDAVIIANVLFQCEDKRLALAEARRVLKGKGRLFIVDWKDSFGGLGPQKEHVVPKEEARRLAEESGFSFERAIPDAGAHHYGIVCSL